MPMGRKQKKWMGLYMTLVLIATVGATTVFAAGDPLSVINNLSTFIFSLIRAIGLPGTRHLSVIQKIILNYQSAV